MAKILKRTGAAFDINDTGEQVPADGQLVIDPTKYQLYSRSNDTIAALANGNLTYNDGEKDLTLSEATMHLQGSFPKEVGLSYKTALGIPKIAMVKPDGDSKTLISHNFCDKTTWADPNDSTWTVEPPSGFRYLLQKAEVQFSHDVQLETLATPGEMHSEIFYQGASLPDHHKIFKSIMDVFDLGNKHHTMNATVDGVPGVTTVVFDYTDSIVLESAAQMKMVFSTLNNLELGGKHCSVSVVATPEAY